MATLRILSSLFLYDAWRRMGSRRIAPRFLNLENRRRCVVNVRPRAFCRSWKAPHPPPVSRSVRSWLDPRVGLHTKWKNMLTQPAIESRLVGHPAHSIVVIILSMLNQLLSQFNTSHTRWRSLLRHCATSREVAGSISDGVIGIFHWHNLSDRTVALGVDSVPNRNEYQEYFLGGKGGRTVGLTLQPSCADCVEIWQPQAPGTLQGLSGHVKGDFFNFYIQRKATSFSGRSLCFM